MRVQSLMLAAAAAALLAPASAVLSATPAAGPSGNHGAPAREGAVLAAGLLAKVRGCAVVSNGRYRSDDGTRADIPVCGAPGAVYWKADMDIDCDGRPGPLCNGRTDPLFSDTTAFQQSDGRYLSAETLPYIVVPAASGVWNFRDHGIGQGSVAAVIYGDRVQYAVVGDTGPEDIIGEASYATARALGIRADPRGGGTPSGVTYLVFKNSRVSPIEDHDAAVATGERLAREFVNAANDVRDVSEGRDAHDARDARDARDAGDAGGAADARERREGRSARDVRGAADAGDVSDADDLSDVGDVGDVGDLSDADDLGDTGDVSDVDEG